MRAQKDARVVARALREAQDEAHVLREVESVALEQATLHQALDVAEHRVFDLIEQLVDVVIVEVEGRPVVAGAVRDLPHGDLLDGLLGVELPERLAEVGARLFGDLRLLLHGGLPLGFVAEPRRARHLERACRAQVLLARLPQYTSM